MSCQHRYMLLFVLSVARYTVLSVNDGCNSSLYVSINPREMSISVISSWSSKPIESCCSFSATYLRKSSRFSSSDFSGRGQNQSGERRFCKSKYLETELIQLLLIFSGENPSIKICFNLFYDSLVSCNRNITDFLESSINSFFIFRR